MRNSKIGRWAVSLAAVCLCAGTATNARADLVWGFGPSGVFSGTGPNTTGDWLSATLKQVDANDVSVTLQWLNVASGTKLVANGGDNGGFYMNFKTSPAGLSLSSPPSGITAFFNEDGFKADGDGNYDILVNTDAAFVAGTQDTITFTIQSTGAITPDDFDTPSTLEHGGNGTWDAAAHIGGYNNSVWAGTGGGPVPPAVPEPATALAGVLLLLPLGASAVRILRKTRA